MSKRISSTTAGDAPLSAARNPDAHAVDSDADSGDELIGRTVTINRPRDEVYAFWRKFENLAMVMENIESVTPLDERRSHWVVKAPAGKTVEWDSEIVEDIPNERIRWQSSPGADIANSGEVQFRDAPGHRGTLVTATIVYDPPAGTLGKLVAKVFQREPKIQSRRDLRRFKQLLETGEIATARMNVNPTSETSH
ncbi:MAG: SRPBCC family protein [Steroidobacter sp.]